MKQTSLSHYRFDYSVSLIWSVGFFFLSFSCSLHIGSVFFLRISFSNLHSYESGNPFLPQLSSVILLKAYGLMILLKLVNGGFPFPISPTPNIKVGSPCFYHFYWIHNFPQYRLSNRINMFSFLMLITPSVSSVWAHENQINWLHLGTGQKAQLRFDKKKRKRKAFYKTNSLNSTFMGSMLSKKAFISLR